MKLFNPAFLLIIMLPGIFIFPASSRALQDQAGQEGRKPLIIDAGKQRIIENAAETKPIKEIKEKESKMPEIPKRITREKLDAAENIRLAELERKRASGAISQIEYDLEKDTLFRESNITF